MIYRSKLRRSTASAVSEPLVWPAAGPERTCIVAIIRRGFNYPQIRAVQQAYQLPDRSFSRLIGISDKTLTRIKTSHAKLSAMSGDRLYRLRRIWELANDVLGSPESALAWLRRPQIGLGRQVPIELLDTEPGYEQVQTLLNRIDYGVLP